MKPIPTKDREERELRRGSRRDIGIDDANIEQSRRQRSAVAVDQKIYGTWERVESRGLLARLTVTLNVLDPHLSLRHPCRTRASPSLCEHFYTLYKNTVLMVSQLCLSNPLYIPDDATKGQFAESP